MQTSRSKGATRMTGGLLAAATLSAALVGCGTVSRDYPGVSREALWGAAVGAAEHPEYSDWVVADNGVFIDETDGRIEIFRELKRDHARNGGGLKREAEKWVLSVNVETSDRIPKVRVESRNSLRAKGFLAQADHYFAEIDQRLAHSNLAAPAVAATPAVTASPNGLELPTAHEPVKRVTEPAPVDAGRQLQSP